MQLKGGFSSSVPEVTRMEQSISSVDSGVISPFGWYCCEIPDSSGTDQRLCANLGK